VYSAMEWMAVLANLAPVGRHGESCPRPGAASRVAVWNILFGRRPYADLRVQLTEGSKVHNSGRGDVLSSWVLTAAGRVLQCPGWLHSGRDGCTWPKVTGETLSTGLMSRRLQRGRGVSVRTSFEGSAVLFRGVRRGGCTRVGGTVSRS
jgi:hypothetical protein